MNEDKHEDNIEKIERVCPVCRTPVEQYLFTGLFMPLENRAREIIDEIGKAGISPCITVDNMIPSEMVSIHLASRCPKCGFISIWAVTQNDIENIDKLPVGWIYNPENIESAIKKLPENMDILKKNLEKILTFSRYMYGENYEK